jgi:hypothetical protein
MLRSEALDQLAEHIVRIERLHSLRVAIDGIDAAGKTRLADELVEPVNPLATARAVAQRSVQLARSLLGR